MNGRTFPQTIYHYTSADGLHGILSSGTLYFTDSLFLNDRNERKNFYQMLKHYLDTESMNEAWRRVLYERYFGRNDYIAEHLTSTNPADREASRYFVLSCCRDRDSLPMWNYYTRSIHAAGYNLHFDTEELINQMNKHPGIRKLSTKREPVLCREILYEEQEKLAELSGIVRRKEREWSECCKDTDKEAILTEMDRICEAQSLFYKDRAFSHEKELRIVIATDNEKIGTLSDRCYQFRKVRGIQVPYLAIDVLEKGRAIIGVTAGPALDKEMAVNGVEYMLYYYGFPQTCKVSAVPLRY